MVLSAFSSISLEDVAKASGEGLRWFHLALTMPDDLIKEHVERAEQAGYKALVITVDRPNVGLHRNNEGIMNKNLLIKFANFSVPKTTEFIKHQHGVYFSQPITWDRIEWVRSLSTLPIVLKGIMTADDALLALEHKMDGIIVSNHGGRQLDCVPATVSAYSIRQGTLHSA
jgi:(S)-2-hydroxy-acid oxidase